MARIALLPLVLLILSCMAQPASAIELDLPPILAAAVGEEAEEEDESGAVEAAIDECEEDPGACEEEGTEAEESSVGPPQCALRSVKARAAIKHGKLKVTVGYSTSEPVKATIQIDNGSTRIGTFKRRLGKSGVLRFTQPLSEKQRIKRIAVRIQLATRRVGCPTRFAAKRR